MPTTDLSRQKAQLHDRGICAVIPTYNNAGTVADVVRRTLEQCADVIVVNDGSTDDTPRILSGISGITLVNLPQNQGKGSALKAAFRRALSMGFSYAITLDADGQHYPDNISLFLKANRLHPGAMIIGSRQLEGVQRSKGSSFANRFSNFWFYIQTGCRLEDTQTGYRLYPLKKLYGLSLLTSRYEAELELMVFASWHGVELIPISIPVYYPAPEDRVSHFRPGMDFLRITVLNTVLCFFAVVYGLPLRLLRFLGRTFRTVYSLLFTLFFLFCVFTPLAWLYVKIGRMTPRKVSRLHSLMYHAVRFVMLHHGIPGVKFSSKVADGVDFNKPSVIICNHQSHIDLACQLIFTPRIIFLTNNWVWNNPLYGFLIRHAEYYPVAEGIDELMPKLRSLVERGYSIAVFPEGTRSRDCRIGRFHQGAFHIAAELGLDILPMYLYGPGRILPKRTYHLRKGPIYIEVDHPIPQSALQAMGDSRQQAAAIRQRYISKYESISNRIEQDV